MVRIAGNIRINAPLEKVFDTAADSRNEPSYNPGMKSAELLTPEPVGAGSRFRASMGGSPRSEMIVELTDFDRPHRVASRTRSAMMETSGSLTFTENAGGTVMAWDWDVRPKGWFKIFGPLVGPMGRRQETRIWSGLKHSLETGGSGP